MVESFFTIKENVNNVEIIEKKSKFIANLLKVDSEEDALNKLANIKKKERNANHNVFAFRIVNGIEKFSDDGEPSGTAGVPILDILRGEKLQNVLLVVTRYFGGTLLGTGGLVRAYSTAAKNAICDSKKVEMKLCDEYDIFVDYNYHDILLHFFKGELIKIKDTDFKDKVHFCIIVENSRSQKIIDNIIEKTDRTATVSIKETYYHA